MDVMEWLLDSDPAIRWQVERDLLHSPDDEVAAERARIESEGWGARLLDLQGDDGQWDGRVWVYRQWTATLDVMQLLFALGVDPAGARAHAAMARLLASEVTWGEYHFDNPFAEGETEACINGRVLSSTAHFGIASDRLAARLVGEQLDDGGWNCYTEESSRSSFNSTICVLEGLLAYEKSRGATPELTRARMRGHEYLLERGLFRSLRTGEVVDDEWLLLAFPTRWHYDILWALDYLRSAGVRPDERAAEAVGILTGKQDAEGRWPLEHRHHGDAHFEMEEVGEPSRWNTLRALRVLDWYRREA